MTAGPDPAGGRGVLFLVVGPSGAGKDTLIEAAHAASAGDDRLVFPVREITRPADAGGEAHRPVDTATFSARRGQGAYALAWEAHGLGYGIPVSVTADLAAGRSVVVNVSRSVIDEARRRFPPVTVIQVAVPEDLLRRRLADRGRETADQIEARVARAGAFQVTGDDVVTLVNDGPVADSVERFRAILAARA